MPQTVITVIGNGLDTVKQNQLAALIKSLGIEALGFDILDKNYAIDIKLPLWRDDLTKALRERLALPGFDIFVQADDAFRRKKLFMADMDATMIVGETLDDLAAKLNIKDKVAPITERAMRGELDFHEALNLRVAMLKGTHERLLHEMLNGLHFATGAMATVRTMAAKGARCVLISGGFDLFTQYVAAKLGFHENFGNQLEIEAGVLTGRVIPPIVDKTTKQNKLREITVKLGIDPRATMAVGDGANDIPMLQTAGAGVGYFGKPAVQAATPHQIRHTDLKSLLYMQGYKAEEIIF